MNDYPRLYGQRVQNTGCGYLAMQNTARAWWQSRHMMPDPPQLTNLAALAAAIRAKTTTKETAA